MVAPSLAGMPLASPNSGATVPHWHKKCEARAIAQRVDNQSSSLSLMMLTIFPSVHISITRGTCLENLDSSGTTRKMTSSLYPAISLTWTQKITKPRGLVLMPPNPIKLRGLSMRSPSGRWKLVLTNVVRCNHVHLTATVSQSINIMPLYFETHKSLRTRPVCS